MICQRLVLGLLACILLSFLSSGCSARNVNNTPDGGIGVSENNPALQYFTKTHPEKEVIKCASGDLNGDNIEDLVVIYRESKEKNSMLAVLYLTGQYECTNEVPAPVSNQQIQFKDIDQKTPVEFIVQGMKGANVGYAIYRVEGTKLEDLFGEGMKDCC